MTLQEIDECNELLAIFEGWELVEREGVDCFVKDGYRRYYFELNYHAKWDCLISIWQMFRDLKFEEVINQFHHSDLKWIISQAICYGTIDSAFESLVKAIEWYNSINK